MKVFKFGGASVKDAKAVHNMTSIIKSYTNDHICVVVSAMGKTTNHLEDILNHIIAKSDHSDALERVKDYHLKIVEDLFPFRSSTIYRDVHELIDELRGQTKYYSGFEISQEQLDKAYSRIVSYGELLSTKIISAYLNENGLATEWIDIRKVIKTKEYFVNAEVNWDATMNNVRKQLPISDVDDHKTIFLTQGFISSNEKGETTTLGREGSDFTGAILSWCLNAEELVIWKDVEGLMNADPKKFEDAQLLENISYREALELSFYGATVIHPKTIKPLENKKIPLKVKSFLKPNAEGTRIDANQHKDNFIPSFISKTSQTLFSISPRDFSMVVEKNISDLYGILAEIGIRINLMQNSALNFSICFDSNDYKRAKLEEALSERYKFKFNENLQLLTVRHYNEETLSELLKNKEIVVQQLSRTTARFLMKS